MQKLLFEKAWNKTISEADRTEIKTAFQKAVLFRKPAIQFSQLWQAMNHKGDLLITVIIHNVSEDAFPFKNQTLYYRAEEKTAAKHNFTLPVEVKAKTSMPWTFIFPKESIISSSGTDIGIIELEKSYDPS